MYLITRHSDNNYNYEPIVCDTDVSDCFDIYCYFPDKYIVLYQKINKKIIYHGMSIINNKIINNLRSENYSHMLFCKSKFVAQTQCYQHIYGIDKVIFIDDNNQLYTIGIYRYNNHTPQVVHHTYQNYLFKDFRFN